MKSRVGCSVLMMCMFCGFILNAQAEDTSLAAGRSLFDLGLKAAVSLPSFFWLEDNSWNGVTSLAIMPAAWAFVAVNLTDTVAVQVEGGYTGKGCRVSASDGKLLWLFNYLEIPIMIKYSYSADLLSATAIWVGGGGYFGKFLGGRYKFDVPGSEWIGTGSLSTGDQEKVTEIRPYDYGFLLSFGTETGNFLSEFRFFFGLTPALAFTPADTDFGGYRKAVNSGFLFAFGYQF